MTLGGFNRYGASVTVRTVRGGNGAERGRECEAAS